MTDDLVKRLRSGDYTIKMTDGSIQYLNHVAADRIEQLEAAYAQQQQVWSDAIARADRYEEALRQFADENNWEEWVGWVGDGEPQEIARAALGEKKDDQHE